MTEKLSSRPLRPPNFELEAKALKRLSKSLLEPKSGVLQELTDIMLETCLADSAGISIAEKEGTEDIFRWKAISGSLKGFLHGTMPRHFSPCGVVVDRCEALLIEKPIRYWSYIERLGIPLYEVLLVPFFSKGKSVGTLWAVSHRPDKTFDLEDKRLLNALAEMAGLAVDTNERILALATANKNEKEKGFIKEMQARDVANERDNLLKLLEMNPSPNVLWRSEYLIFERISPSYQALFPGRQLIGKSFKEALPEKEYEHIFEVIKGVFQSGNSITMNEQLVPFDLDGKGMQDRFYTLSFFQIKDDKGMPYGVYQQAVDNTEQIYARKALERAKLAAELATQAKSTFLANMSHEIRTPLGAILGFTDLLKEKDITQAEQREFFDIISRNGKALTRIIDDVLDLAKVESGKMDIEMVDFSLTVLIDEVQGLFRERTQSKDLSLHAFFEENTPSQIVSDPMRLRQILINIVGNAVKFTNKGGISIQVSSVPLSEKKVQIQIEVKDTGVGLSTEQRERLFQPFMQADNSTTRKYGGTGLGLSLSQRLAQAMGGNISIKEHTLGKGCNFVITILADLPKTLPKRGSANNVESNLANSETNLPLKGVQILVAEDSKDNQFLVKRILSRAGAIVTIAENGLIAFRNAIEGEFDVVLMDIQMPEMDGYEATRSLRESGFNKPIIALTAHAMAEERARTLAAGCNGHLTKPINQTEMIKLILQLTTR